MKTIHKYPLLITDVQHIPSHKYAKAITVQYQNGYPHIWAEVDVTDPAEDMIIHIFGTGHEIIGNLNYISTIQQDTLVWHIYQQI